MKICPVGADLLHAYGQTDGQEEAYSRFSNFVELYNDQSNNF